MGQIRPELKKTAKLWREFLYSRIMNIFEYENVPEEIDLQSLKLFLFFRGKIVFYKIGDEYLIQPFDYTDKLNKYYIPTNGRVVNPWLPKGHQNWEFSVEDEAIIYNSTPDVRKFALHSIVSDLIWKTANQLAENDISYYCIQRNHRLVAIFTAESDKQKAECNRVLDRLYEGYPDITMEEDLVSHIKVNPITMNSTRSSITELIEFQQYVLANFYHSFGINSNYNLKREQLNSNEIDVNKEVLRLNIDDMLKCREEGVSKVNAKYGLDIRVHLNEEVYKDLLQAEQLVLRDDTAENISQTGDIEDENSSQFETSGNGMSGEETEDKDNKTENTYEDETTIEGEDSQSGQEMQEETDQKDGEMTITIPDGADVSINIDLSQSETKSDDTEPSQSETDSEDKSKDNEEKESDEDDNKTEDAE